MTYELFIRDEHGNERVVGNINKAIHFQPIFEKIIYMRFGDINLSGATWSSQFDEKIKKYKFKKEDLVILHISIPKDNIVRMVNIEPITQEGMRQVIKDAEMRGSKQ